MEDYPGVREIVRLKTVDSTQAIARKLAVEGAPEGTLVWADRQSKGRGRMGRRWASASGGLYVSLVLRPPVAPERLAELSLTTAEAVANALATASGLKTTVKPPNDVLAAVAPEEKPGPAAPAVDFRKVCGILAEASGNATRVDWVVLGIGINVNNRVPKTLKKAASLKDLSGREFDVGELLRSVLAEFQARYKAFLSAANGHLRHPPNPGPPAGPDAPQ